MTAPPKAKIKASWGTWIGVVTSVGTLLPPLVTQVVALFENTAAHWSGAEKTSVITGAVIAFATLAGRFGQAVAHILQGKEA